MYFYLVQNKMRKIKFIIHLLFLLPLIAKAQFKTGFEIMGHLEGLQDGDKILLGNRFTDWHHLTKVDSCIATNGNFKLYGATVPEGPRLYEMIFESVKKNNRETHRKFSKELKTNIGGGFITLLINQ